MHAVLVYRGRYHIREALDFETLAAVLRQGGHEVTLVYDPDVFGVTDNVLQIGWLARRLSDQERIVQRIVDAKPGVVLLNVLSSTHEWCLEVAAQVKQRTGAATVFLGFHPSVSAESVVQNEGVDYVIQGEAEGVVNPLLDALADGREPSDVGNLLYRKNGDVVQTRRAEPVDLDALPLPDKDLFAPYVSHAYSYMAMVSRGCPYLCTFCEETCSKKLYGSGYYRRKSVDTVLRELAEGKRRYQYKEVIFKDSYLAVNREWTEELIARYKAEIGVPFKCFCTILGFDRDMARLLKGGGCYGIEFGFQTWNDRIRREVLNRRETAEQAVAAFEACAEEKLWYDVDHMFGLPTETEQDHIEGALRYRELRYMNRVKVHHLLYLPTADIIEHGIAAGALPADAHERLAAGWESDFYDAQVGSEEERKAIAGYAALYKLLPIMPRWLVRWFTRNGRVRWLRHIPSPLMALLQALNALRTGDLRFRAYLSFYPRKVWLGLRRR